jgi:hypothetical protein
MGLSVEPLIISRQRLCTLSSDKEENTSVVQQLIYANHTENTSSYVVVFTAHFIATEVACVFVYAEICLPSRYPVAGLHATIILEDLVIYKILRTLRLTVSVPY